MLGLKLIHASKTVPGFPLRGNDLITYSLVTSYILVHWRFPITFPEVRVDIISELS